MGTPRLLLVHAHPDDESLWTGGLIARHTDAGGEVDLVMCTWTDGTVRHRELADAVDILGMPRPPIMLGYADDRRPESAPDAQRLCEASFDEQVRALTHHIRAVQPDIVITYDPLGIYGHPDHVHAHRLACAAAGVVAAVAAIAAANQIRAGWQLAARLPEPRRGNGFGFGRGARRRTHRGRARHREAGVLLTSAARSSRESPRGRAQSRPQRGEQAGKRRALSSHLRSSAGQGDGFAGACLAGGRAHDAPESGLARARRVGRRLGGQASGGAVASLVGRRGEQAGRQQLRNRHPKR